MRMNRWVLMAGVAAGLCLGMNQVQAQQDNGGGGGGGGRRGNFDPAQFQQRMMDRYKEMLEVSNDDEWKVLQPVVQKVMDARMQSFSGGGGMRGMFGGRRGGGNAGDNTNADQGGGRPRGFFGQQPSAEAEALQKAIDAKAPKAEIKAALAKYVESRKTKQADLEKAQDELRKLLTARQEAIATLNGLL